MDRMVLRLSTFRFYLRTVMNLLPPLAFGCVWFLRFSVPWATSGAPQYWAPYVYLLAITTITWSIAAEHYGVTSVDELFREQTGIRAALTAGTVTYATDLLLLFLTRATALSRSFFLLSAMALPALAVVTRAVFRHIVRNHSSSRNGIRLLVVGADAFACHTSQRLCSLPFIHCRVEAYVRFANEPVVPQDARILDFSELPEFDAASIDEVVIALPPSRISEIRNVMPRLETLCRPIRAVMDLGDDLFIRDKLFQLERLQFLDLGATPAESSHYAIVKRAFDIGFALLALLLMAPFMIAIAAIIKLSSPGPAWFRQDRVGLNGQVFSMLKFRTMRVTSGAESDTRWTTENDPRRTSIGTFLRKTSLDELPQFFNVLQGHMSVVGPRPERPHFVRKFQQDIERYHWRHRLKAGITGWAQVNGWRGDTSIQKRIEHDLYYLQNWSLLFDLRIIFMTLWCGLFGKNAY